MSYALHNALLAFALLLALNVALPAWADDAEDCANAETLVKTKPARPVAACRRLADRGNAPAQYNLGFLYYNGWGLPKDYAEAARWYRKAAEQGLAIAQYNLGLLYDNGEGVAQDYAVAAKWYRKAAEQGLAQGQGHLGYLYYDGLGVPKNQGEAMRWYRKAADQGYAPAQYNLGDIYFQGQWVAQDYAEAARWYRKAADEGLAVAQFNLGHMYYSGQGVPQDYAESMRWFRKAADHGYANAQISLGVMYNFGQGVPQDYAEAASWFRKAADQGYTAAQFNLGILYAKGQGIPQNYVQAHLWLSLSAAQGDADAAKYRDLVARLMTPSQIEQAQALAAAWKPVTQGVATMSPPTSAPPTPPSAAAASIVGTGFFVSHDGYVLTAAHVVAGCAKPHLEAAGADRTANIIARDQQNDLALLKADAHPADIAHLRLSIRQGEDVAVYGFPLAGLLASGGNITNGIVTALAGIADDSRFLQISAPVQPGNSGGPLLDQSGNVIGIVVSKLDALKVASLIEDIPQNVNFAIKASVAGGFLDANNVAYESGHAGAKLALADIAERAKMFTVGIACGR